MIIYKSPAYIKRSWEWTDNPSGSQRQIAELTNTIGSASQRLISLPITGASLLPFMAYASADTVLSSAANLNMYLMYESDGALSSVPAVVFNFDAGPWTTNGLSGIFHYPQSNYVRGPAVTDSNFVIVSDVGPVQSGRLRITVWFINANLPY